jgi:hypothetical protein
MGIKKASLKAFIAHFESWCLNNGQEFNVDKCSALYLGNNNSKDPYSICNTIIATDTDSVRDLGLIVTPDLKWKKHTQSKINITLRKWYNFMRIIKSQNLHTLCHIYKSYIRPTLEFPSVIFNSFSQSTTIPLEAAQRKITRHICFKSGKFQSTAFPNYRERLKILNLEPLEIRRLKLDLVLFHKISNGLIKVDRPVVDLPRHSHNTRFRHNKTAITRARILPRYNSFFVRVPKKFCKLPLNLQHCTDPYIFRKQLDTIDLSSIL